MLMTEAMVAINDDIADDFLAELDVLKIKLAFSVNQY